MGTLSIVPLRSVPSQSLQIILGGQDCTIKVYHKAPGLFFDLSTLDGPVVAGRICRDRNLLVRYERLGFSGDLFFADTQGTDDPAWTRLRDRFQLFYLPAE